MRARENAGEITKMRDEQQQRVKSHHEQLTALQDLQLSSKNSKIKNIKGPFQHRLDKLWETMNLKRQVYHKGALIGNDVKKIFQPRNIKKIVHSFKPMQVNLQNMEWKVFSDKHTMNKVATLLTKLSLCFALYSPSHPLCRHEVALLAVRCASFGGNFPKVNLLRKFHVLTYHVPEKAISKGTVGMEAEHCSESIHPVVNRLDMVYATTQNACDRLALVAKSQWLQSDTTLTNFKKPKENRKTEIIQTEEFVIPKLASSPGKMKL